jgi:hypothetical protein
LSQRGHRTKGRALTRVYKPGSPIVGEQATMTPTWHRDRVASIPNPEETLPFRCQLRRGSRWRHSGLRGLRHRTPGLSCRRSSDEGGVVLWHPIWPAITSELDASGTSAECCNGRSRASLSPRSLGGRAFPPPPARALAVEPTHHDQQPAKHRGIHEIRVERRAGWKGKRPGHQQPDEGGYDQPSLPQP